MNIQRSRRRLCESCVGALVILAMVIASCSGEADDSGAHSAIDLGKIALTDPLIVPYSDGLGDAVLLPRGESAAQWIELADEQLCVTTLAGADPERSCGSATLTEASFDRKSFAWSADGSTVHFTPDFARNGQEPDIWSFDPSTGAVRNLTDDGADEVQDDGAVIDIAPFTTEQGALRFFTLSPQDPASVELSTIDPDGRAAQLPEVRLNGLLPIEAVHPIGRDRFVYRTVEGETTTLALLDLRSGDANVVPLRQFELPAVVASSTGAIVTAAFDGVVATGNLSYEVIDFVIGETSADQGIERHRLDLGIPPDAGVPMFGLSPDGSTVVALFEVPESGTIQMVASQRNEAGNFGEPIMLGAPGFLGEGADGGPNGLAPGARWRHALWTDDNQLLIPATDGVHIFSFTTTGNEEG